MNEKYSPCEVNIDEKLATLRFICDNNSHIKVNFSLCQNCADKPCLHFCPADVYECGTSSGILNVNHENCLECGTCRICCPKGAIEWNNPSGGSGVRYKFG